MAEIWKVDDSCFEAAIEYSVRLIHRGQVVSFPTDAFYALGADPFNLAAVREVCRIKGRAFNRPVPLLVAALDQAADLTSNPPACSSNSPQNIGRGR
ncbi:MAG TPA: Sua5/YciO/YrdC/YwlC family protein [Terriglobia bacterium]|nr:Sua5/YciO/YrdC/YwlC family protein [Terriglobia bacterium]